ncbi:MAG: methyltransferase domain-containing protein [Frankia sp.]|nr:methyltransferase domain-containing protein [Frankia sp.]
MSVFDVLDLVTGYQGAAVVTAACRLGVFDALDAGPLPAPQVAARLGTDPSATRALLDALAGHGLLASEAGPVDAGTGEPGPSEQTACAAGDGGGRWYRLTDDGRRLTADGDLRLVAVKEAFFARVWLGLADSIRAGRPRLAPWADRLAGDPEQARAFLRALVVLARETGLDVATLPGVTPGARVADLGGGLGSYALPLARAGAVVTLVDLPDVIAWADAELTGTAPEVRARITLTPADLLAPDAVARIGAGHDLVLLSHLLHEFADADAATVLGVAHAVTRPGGQVVVFELPGDPGPPPGVFGPMFDLMMRVETPGRARRRTELVALLRSAGLADVHVSAAHPLPHGVVIGTRPDAG